jgi:hypothetical protein
MRRIARSWGRIVMWVVGGLGAALLGMLALPACNTPFIPLPPPGDPTFTPVAMTDGVGGQRTLWETRGAPSSAMGEARVFVYNVDGGSGVIVRAQPDGSYVTNPFDGKPGDRIQIHYVDRDARNSPDICRVLQQGLAQTPCTP